MRLRHGLGYFAKNLSEVSHFYAWLKTAEINISNATNDLNEIIY